MPIVIGFVSSYFFLNQGIAYYLRHYGTYANAKVLSYNVNSGQRNDHTGKLIMHLSYAGQQSTVVVSGDSKSYNYIDQRLENHQTVPLQYVPLLPFIAITDAELGIGNK